VQIAGQLYLYDTPHEQHTGVDPSEADSPLASARIRRLKKKSNYAAVQLHRKEEWCEKEARCSGREGHEGRAPWAVHCSGEEWIHTARAQSTAQDSGFARPEVGDAPLDWKCNPYRHIRITTREKPRLRGDGDEGRSRRIGFV
jgi:hypothetical protein